MATPIVVIPARCVALRKALWTLVRLMGAVAGSCGADPAQVAGKSQVWFRWVFQEVRSSVRVSAGRGT